MGTPSPFPRSTWELGEGGPEQIDVVLFRQNFTRQAAFGLHHFPPAGHLDGARRKGGGEGNELPPLCWRASLVPRGPAVPFCSLLAESPSPDHHPHGPAHPVQTLGQPVSLGNAHASCPSRY